MNLSFRGAGPFAGEPVILPVIAGLDPAIHLLAKMMDPRVKPAGDGRESGGSILPNPALVEPSAGLRAEESNEKKKEQQ